MKIKKANTDDLLTVKNIASKTISAVYPHYYPCGAVDFFLEHHSIEKIKRDIESGNVYICVNEADCAVGTVTICANSINRLFVLPEYQHRGFGRALLDFSETLIASVSDTIRLDASLPAKAIYLKRGYAATEFHSIKTDNGDFLCYDIMEKKYGCGF